ncbi:MAG: T9SS type A sorting domain-containing protein [Bacteroidota bacterium]|nr:T9SS type A sorting domain-containing protein [Bacteroidota bacterium]
MKKIYSTILFALIILGLSIQSQAQSYILNWANRVGDTWNDRALSSVEDASGNIYTTGNFNGVVDFDSGPGTFTLTTLGGYDTYILKTDANGVFQWVKHLESYSTTGNLGSKMVVDGASNIYVGGYFSGIVDFDPGPGTNTVAANGSSADIFVCKLNSLGNLQWVKTFGGSLNDVITSMSINSSNLYITGEFAGVAVDFDPGPSTSTISSNGLTDVFIAKYDLNGTFGWAKGFGGLSNETGNSIACNTSGDVYVCGSFNNTVDFDAGPSTTTLTSVGNTDAFIVKYNTAGNFQWVRGFGSNLNDVASTIELNSTGDVFTGGVFSGTVDFDTGPGTFTVASNGNSDAFIHKLDASGIFQWVKTFGGAAGNDGVNALKIDPSGNIFSTGAFKGVVDFDPSANTYTLAAVSNGDIFIHKLDGLGNFTWAGALNSYTTTGNNVPTSITTNTAGNISVSGYFLHTVDFDPSANTYTLTNLVNPGAYDFFVAKYSPCIAPNAPINTTLSNLLSICDGNATSLSVSGTGTVNWYNTATSTTVLITSNNYVTPTLSLGTYTYYAEANTCTVSASRTPITVTVNPNPTVTLVSSSNSICAGESATLTASGANSYTWILPIGVGSSIVVSPMTTTIFTVTGTNSFGCTNTATLSQIVNACVGLKENSKLNESIHIYPNPAKDIFTIHSLNTIEEVTITDMVGKRITHYNFDNGIIEPAINLSNIPSGVYFVTIKSNTTKATVKIIKQ